MAVTDTPSLARSFYQRFLASADRIAFLEGLVNSSPPTFETEWLEFKMYPQELHFPRTVSLMRPGA